MVVRELDHHPSLGLCECNVVVKAICFSVSPDYDRLLRIRRADKNEEIEVVYWPRALTKVEAHEFILRSDAEACDI
jgi:hypothetical protein